MFVRREDLYKARNGLPRYVEGEAYVTTKDIAVKAGVFFKGTILYINSKGSDHMHLGDGEGHYVCLSNSFIRSFLIPVSVEKNPYHW